MQATLKISNAEDVNKTIIRTEKAIKELRDCLWNLSKLEVEVELTPAKK
ncbi:hypothetical protein Salpa_5869 [Sporomusa sp. KB1]|jgi:hypothetical protein|nr:hypothetical protein Salpa_5869 [Sporomusa sp. KB1]